MDFILIPKDLTFINTYLCLFHFLVKLNLILSTRHILTRVCHLQHILIKYVCNQTNIFNIQCDKTVTFTGAEIDILHEFTLPDKKGTNAMNGFSP